jgi:branched-chain amino acid transport system substrate-binding protein
MKVLEDFHKANHPNDTHDAMYVRGWATAVMWVEGLRRADKAGNLSGEGVKAAIETMKDFDLGGLTNPVTYTPTDHRPSTKTAVFQIQGGKLVKVKDYDMPRKPEWLGL